MSGAFQRHPWLFTAVTSVGAAVVASLAAVHLTRGHEHGHSHSHGEASESDFHSWLHSNLRISEEKEKLLEPLEAEYEEERTRLREEIREAGEAIADAVREEGGPSESLEGALERLSTAQKALQAATLKHFFEMKQHLDPRQAERLLQWTHDSIINKHSH